MSYKEPTIIMNDNVAYFDVDDTLLMWTWSPEHDHEAIEIQLSFDRPVARVVPHKIHIERLIRHKMIGNAVVVWSRSGWQWAQAAVFALGLQQHVDACMAKPFYHYDDKKCCDILGEHRYIPYGNT